MSYYELLIDDLNKIKGSKKDQIVRKIFLKIHMIDLLDQIKKFNHNSTQIFSSFNSYKGAK